MKAVYCNGKLKAGRFTGAPCRKFLGNLTPPYKDVICPRCGHKNNEPN